MAKIKFGQGLELEHEEGGEYVLRFRAPKIKIPSDPTGGHLKQAKKEVLLAVRSILDRAIKVEEEKGKD
ncbi:hypothetical protein ES703_99511 [subsurface metagenome]